jgi:toxin ParE1/3/4
MSFRLTREAAADVADIYRYSFDNFGETQADTYHDRLSECFRLLADTPFLGRDYSFLRPGLRRHEHASHSVYYRVTDTGILILRVLHQRMDPAQHL